MDVLHDIGNTAVDFLIGNGWYLFGLLVLYGAFRHKIDAAFMRWRRRWDEYQYAAKYHKDSDLARSRLESVKAARDRMQQEHENKAALAEIKRKEKEAQKKAELASKASEHCFRLGSSPSSSSKSGLRSDYMPLMGDTGSGGYRAPKKSCCKKGGGCG